MNRYFLSLGSNIEPEKYIPEAIVSLQECFNNVLISTVYETDPVGPAGSKKFWNLAAAIETPLDPKSVAEKLREIEARLGRKRSQDKFAPRTMDIDLLPQPDYQQLAFIMVPLAEIAPAERDPETGKTFRELAEPLAGEASRFRKVR